jgi:hypothetical protein
MYKLLLALGLSDSKAIPETKACTGPQFFPRAPELLSNLAKLPQEDINKKDGSWVKSNDVAITGLEKYRVAKGEHLMLIASMSMNPIAVACELAINSKMQIIPQVVMIDNSENASITWKALRHFFKDNNSFSKFKNQLRPYLIAHHATMTLHTEPENIEKFADYVLEFVEDIIRKYQYDFVKAVVLQTVYLEQRWEDECTFDGIKNFIDISGCKNIFVYPSNIVTLSYEHDAVKICQNISRLNPRLSIHVNMNIDEWRPTEFLLLEGEAENKPDEALKRITAAIRFNPSPAIRIIGIAIYSFSPEQLKIHMWSTMHKALEKMIADNHYEFTQHDTPFILDVIFKMAGINIKIDKHFQELAEYFPVTVFHVDILFEEMKNALIILNKKFPSLNARFPTLGQVKARDDWPTRITLDMQEFINTIIRLIPPYLSENPLLRMHYENMCIVRKTLAKLFHNHGFGMSVSKSDCFEETLCLLVRKRLEAQGIEVKELVTTNSMFNDNPTRKDQTDIFLTTPIDAALHIVNYFNHIRKDTASMEEKQEWVENKNAYLTKITVANSTLLCLRVQEDLTFAVKNLISKEAIENYWRQAGYVRPFDRYNDPSNRIRN